MCVKLDDTSVSFVWYGYIKMKWMSTCPLSFARTNYLLSPLSYETHHIPIPKRCTPTTPEQEVRTKHSMYPIKPKGKRRPVNSDKLMLWLWRSQEPTNEICSWWAYSHVTFSCAFSSTTEKYCLLIHVLLKFVSWRPIDFCLRSAWYGVSACKWLLP